MTKTLYILTCLLLAAPAVANETTLTKTKDSPERFQLLPLPPNQQLPDYMFQSLPEGPLPPAPEPSSDLWEDVK